MMNSGFTSTAIRSISELLQVLNQLNPGQTQKLADRLALILDSVAAVFTDSSCGFFPATEIAIDLMLPILRGPGELVFPEMLAREASNRKVITTSSDLPPSLHLPESSVIAACPLLVENEIQGNLIVDLHTLHPLSDDQRAILVIFQQVLSAVLAAERRETHYQNDLGEKEEALIQMRNAGMVISSRMELQETLDAILNMAMQVTCARYGIFRLTDRTGKNLLTQAFAGANLSHPITGSLEVGGNTIMGWVAEHREPLCIQDLRQPPWNSLYFPLDVMIEMRSELAVPLIGASGRLEGVLNLESPEVGGFSEQDKSLLQSLAAQSVIAIQEAKLLDSLREIARNLLVQPTLQALDQIADQAVGLVNCDTCSIWMVQSDQIRLQAISGMESTSRSVSLFDSIPGKTALSRSTEIGLSSANDMHSGIPPFSKYMAVPLLTEDERTAVGSVVVTNRIIQGTDHELSDWDKKVLQNLAQFASLAIQNARKQEELQTAQEKQALGETFAMVGDVTSNVLHQMNNRLGTIPVRIQGIRYKRGDILQADEYLRKNLTEIESAANEAMESVRLNLANLRPIELTAVGIHESVQLALQAIKIPERIRVQVNRLDGLPPVRSGNKSLALIFENLIENAIEALEKDGEIIISGERIGKDVRITIRDNGPGIPFIDQSKIFDADYSRRAGDNGNRLGFGLWWVRTLLLRQGGSIRVDSDGQTGTTFHVTLPAYQDGSE